MPTYLYESIPQSGEAPSEPFEVRQGIADAPLVRHPVTGAPVRRVISGGLGVLPKRGGAALPEPGPGCGPGTCGCGRFS